MDRAAQPEQQPGRQSGRQSGQTTPPPPHAPSRSIRQARTRVHLSAPYLVRRSAPSANGADGTTEGTTEGTTDGTADRAAHPAPRDSNRESLVRQAELVISLVLRAGVLVSAAVILIGAVNFYIRYVHAPASFPAHPGFPHTLHAVLTGLQHGDPLAIIALGLLLLLATPVVRVAVSIVAFALEGDRRYVLITSLVLLILLASFALGKAGA